MSDLISRNEAIDAIKKSAMYIPEASTELYMAILAIEGLKPAQEWIPCAVDLPKKDGEYLVCLEKGYREDHGLSEVEIVPFEVDNEGFGYWDEYFDKEKMAILGSDWRELPVLAWMPLPDAYEESEDKE